MVSGIQVLGILFALVLCYFTFLNYKRKDFTLREFVAWIILWVGFAVVTLYPSMFEVFVKDIGVVRAFDLFSVLGFVVVLSISFYTYVNLDRFRKKMERAIRELSLKEFKRDILEEKDK